MFFLYHKKTRPTGRVLAKALGFAKFGLVARERVDFLVRWGNAMPIAVRPGREINTARAISAASDKLRAFNAMKEANVPIPWYTTSQAAAQARVDAGATVFGRTRSGSKGHGIVPYEPGSRVGFHDLYTEWIPDTREYRVHVVGDKFIRLQRKYLEGRDAHAREYIKNHEHGYVFKQPRQKLRADRTDAAIAAVRSLGLDFGAVDLVIGRDDLPYVLEVNTAPACSPLTAQAYVTELAELVRVRSNGDYILHPNFAELEGLRPVGEEVNPMARILHNG